MYDNLTGILKQGKPVIVYHNRSSDWYDGQAQTLFYTRLPSTDSNRGVEALGWCERWTRPPGDRLASRTPRSLTDDDATMDPARLVMMREITKLQLGCLTPRSEKYVYLF